MFDVSPKERREVHVKRFTRKQAVGFLTRGFKEVDIEPSTSELEEVAEGLGGIVGWLTHYGYYRAVRRHSHKEAVSKVFDEASRLVLDELERVIAPSRKRYVVILKAVAHGVTSWSEIKAYVTMKTGLTTDKRFTELLKNLVKYGYLVKEDGKYGISDPIVKFVTTERLQP